MTSTKLSVFNPSTEKQIALLETDDVAAAEAKIERARSRFSDRGSLLQVHERIGAGRGGHSLRHWRNAV